MGRQGAYAAIFLLLAACTPSRGGSSKPADGPPGELEIATEIETASAPREGDLATIVFRITNRFRNAIILKDLTQPRDLMLAGSSGAVVTWQYAQSGLLTYSAEKDEWTYEKGKKAEGPTPPTRPVFNSGLLVPEEVLVVRARVRLLEMPMDFQFSYFELPMDELRRKVYFEARDDKVLRYRTLVGRELTDRLVKSAQTERDAHRIVVFPHAEPVLSNALLKTYRLEQSLRPRFFSLDQAARKAGVPRPRRGEYTYSTVFESWVLPRDSGHALVSTSGVTQLPEVRQVERIFHFIDTIVPEKITVELRAHSAATALGELKYPLVKDEKEVVVTRDVKEKREYYFLFLAADQFPRFLVDLRKLKLILDIEIKERGPCLLVLNK